MFKKMRKYLVVLMAVVMVASFAVIPTAAVFTGGVENPVMVDSWGVYHWRSVYSFCESTDPHWCWARVDDPYGNIYDYYYDSQMTMMAVAVASGQEFMTESLAAAYPGYGNYGGQSK